MGEILANFLAHYSKNSQLVGVITTVLESSNCTIVYPYLVARQPLCICSMHSVARGTPLGGRLLWSLEAALFSTPQGSPGSVRKHPSRL
ncbi:hypothetical protein TNCV_3353291 [Trichonephila clavipes]|nr:hypothetical protein TNCV_3353291 [Trichonephila clavipes]